MFSPRPDIQNRSKLFSEKLRVIGGVSIDEFFDNTQTNLRIRYDVGFSNVASPWFYPIKENSSYDLENETEGESEEGPEGLEAIEWGEEISEMPLSLSDDFNPIKIIENTFAQCRPGLKLPEWFMYSEGLGVALRVQIDPQTFRVYSTPLLNPILSQFTRKHACAKIAIGAGVVDFITSSSPSNIVAAPLEEENIVWSSVQQFIEKSLPLPFPEPGFMYDAETAKFEVLKWFRQTLQSANKSRTSSPLRYGYQLLEEDQLYGCLLRIEDRAQEPERIHNYLVEPAFVDRDQARVAACLQAISEGVGIFLRGFIPVVAAPAQKAPTQKLQRPPTLSEMQYANETVWPQLLAACQDINPRLQPFFFYQAEGKNIATKGKFGCTLKVMIPSTPLSDFTLSELNNNKTLSRKYCVPMVYTSQEDARIAVLCQAGKREIVEFVKNSAPTGLAILPAPSLVKQNPPSKKKKKKKGAKKHDEHIDPRPNVRNTMALKTKDLHVGAVEPVEAIPHTVKQTSTAGPSIARPPTLDINTSAAASVKSEQWIDWDEETKQPDIELTYGGPEIEPGEIVSSTPSQSSTASISMTRHDPQSLRQPSHAHPTALNLPTTSAQNPRTPIPPFNLPGKHAMSTKDNSSMYTSGFGSPFHSPAISFPSQPSIIPILRHVPPQLSLSPYRPLSLNQNFSGYCLVPPVGGGNQYGADSKRRRDSELSEDAESPGMSKQRNSYSSIGSGSGNKRMRPL